MVIIVGDFNARGMNWDSCSPTPECNKKGLCSKLIGTSNNMKTSELMLYSQLVQHHQYHC